MDCFEQVVADIFRQEGYWVQTSFKIKLSDQDRSDLNATNDPRTEFDVLAYKPGERLVRVIECKSFFKSTGVRFGGFTGTDQKAASGLRLFNDSRRRAVLLGSLKAQLLGNGMCCHDDEVRLCFASGHFVNSEERELTRNLFIKMGWDLYDESWLKSKLERLSSKDFGYENSISHVVANLLRS